MIGQLRRLWPEPGPLLRFAVLQALLAVLQGLLLGLLFPVLRAVLRPEPDFAAAMPWLLAGAGGVLLHWALSVVATPVGFAASGELGVQLRLRLMAQLTTLPLGWFTAGAKGTFARTVTSAATAISRLCVVVGGPVITCTLVPLAVTAVTFAVDWRLGLVLLATLPPAFLLLRRCRRGTALASADMEEAANEIAARAIEYGQAQPVLRAAGQAGTGTRQMSAALAEHHRRYARALNASLLPTLSVTGVVALGFVAVLALGVHFLLSGALAVPDTVALLVLAVRFLEPLGALAGHVHGLGALDYGLDRVSQVLRTPPLPAATNPVPGARHSGIDLVDVRLEYLPGRPALAGVNLHCPPGSTTALVGPSGSGKTTVIRLIARFLDATEGVVLVGGQDVRDYDHEQLLGEIAIVFQEAYLFDTTIEDNLRLARPGATDAELAEAARSARLDEVVDRLPEGWRTRVGEGGAQLSGGERQRVAIARAFLKQAPIVLIDEAASALDAENEQAISQAIAALAADPRRTVLVIAHRPTTLAAADQVVALAAGRVVETGTPAELLRTQGAFARIHRQYEQARGWRISAREQEGAPR
ncbi:ABC transporter ATP-binding protein [Crossiella sp. CA-258035]|uniref:ABC transporter ATP-binding protein n=1 Tax=Crossiella sp. CA-258035 TaxID=2981138 RepID=UPI0024BC7556|nr:ABC transporter ATP-binding protein [Crossiella sp. CA-258035]WHT23131.1 ABC transporter ATP-binding protein [Crossiella sp. CA-258035]